MESAGRFRRACEDDGRPRYRTGPAGEDAARRGPYRFPPRSSRSMKRDDKIFIAGHRGLVGSAIVRRLERDGYRNLLVRARRDLDLEDQGAVHRFFEEERP